jgi:hypothetical protein
LKNILCQIDANGRNFHDERSSQLGDVPFVVEG